MINGKLKSTASNLWLVMLNSATPMSLLFDANSPITPSQIFSSSFQLPYSDIMLVTSILKFIDLLNSLTTAPQKSDKTPFFISMNKDSLKYKINWNNAEKKENLLKFCHGTHVDDRYSHRLSEQIVSSCVQSVSRSYVQSLSRFPRGQIENSRFIVAQSVPLSQNRVIVTEDQHLRVKDQIERISNRILAKISHRIFLIG